MVKRPPLKKRATPASKESNKNLMYRVGLYGGVGVQIVVALLVGVYGGIYLDEKLATGPFLTLVGAVLGMTAGFYGLYRIVKLDQKERK